MDGEAKSTSWRLGPQLRAAQAAGFRSLEIFDAAIASSYKGGESVRQLEIQLGISKSRLFASLRRSGVEIAPWSRGRQRLAVSAAAVARVGFADLSAFDRKVAEMRARGFATQAIKLKLGVAYSTVLLSDHRTRVSDRNFPPSGKSDIPAVVS